MLTKSITVLGVLVALAGCERAVTKEAREVRHQDRPAAIDCYAYGERTFSGFSQGAAAYDEAGRLTFIDRANGRVTVIEGECRVVYAVG